MSARSHVDTSTLVDGFATAVERVRTADLGGDEGFYALFEALSWVGAVRDRLRDENHSIASTLNGLYYVRNLVIHRGVDAVAVVVGTYGRAIYGSGTYGGDAHVFPRRSALPPPKSRAGLADYETHVSYNDIYFTLSAAVDEVRQDLRASGASSP